MSGDKDADPYLRDILESIEMIEDYTKDCDVEEFLDNQQLQDAVFRRLEIIGEAVKNLPDEIKNENPEIPWRQIAGLRDILIHAYSRVNPKRVWKIITEDMPDLKAKVEKLVKDL